jgi:NADH:ubiquinone oxidoreductase subunit 6 (subunit J)
MVMRMTTQLITNEHAGASAIGSLLAILIVGAVGTILYFAIDKLNVSFTGLSADATNTINTLEILFVASFVIFLVFVIVNHWINEKSDANGGV